MPRLALIVLFCGVALAGDDLQTRLFRARDRALPALVNVQPVLDVFEGGRRRRSTATGSGVIVREDGLVVTNSHVAGHARKLYCTLAALQQALRGKQAGETVGVEVLELADDGPVTKTIGVELTARDAPDKENRFRARRFGFQAEPLTAQVRRDYGLGDDVHGVHVRRVTGGSPAALARPTALRRGDVILRVGDTPVPDLDALKEALKAIPDGTNVTLFVRHGSDTRFVGIKPEAPADR